jgi:hypothetical protein
MTNRSDRIKAHLAEAKAKTTVSEDAAGDVLRATVAKHKLKRMEGKKKSPALIAKLTARVEAGKRHMTEEAIKKAVKPAPKPTKILTNNPGYGYHGIADAKHKGDTNKAHAEYNRMHAKVKDWAGEAGHLMHAKKPNLMVRDYLDSSRGRHLEGLQADEKYIKKDFGHFARSYDPKLFVESVELDEGRARTTHAVFCVYHSGQYKGMVVHHGGNTSNPAKAQALADRLNASSDAFFAGKHVKEKANYHYEARPRGQRTWMEHAGDPGDDDHSGVYEVQQRDGRYKKVRIRRQPDGKYHIHHADGSKGSTDLNGVKSYISRNSAAWMNEETINEAKSAYAREYDAYQKERSVKTYDEFTKRAHDFAKQRSKQKVDIDFEPRDNTTVSWAKPKGSPHKVMLGIFRHSVADHNKGTGHHVLPKHKAVAAGDFSGRDLFEETINETSRTEDAQRVQYGVMKRDDYLRKWKIGKFGEKKNSLAGPGGLYKNLLVGSNIDNKSAATKK